MKTLTLVILGLCISSGVSATPKVDLGSRARLHASSVGQVASRAKSSSSVIHAFVTLNDGGDVAALENAGATVAGGRGSLVLCEFPLGILPDIEALPDVASIRTERPVSAKIDLARKASNIDMIHSGTELPQAFSGKGVVAGIVDGGIDPNHVNFRNADGSSRISHFTYYRPVQAGGYAEEKYGADYIPRIDTESDETYHGTHTLGILGGSYRGPVRAATRPRPASVTIGEIDNPYYGVAYGADLAVSCGAETDYYVMLGIESILDYAYYDADMAPAVINLSLGSNIGSHDGTSALAQYIDITSDLDNVVFCIAAGNEGDMPISLNRTFTDGDTRVATCLFPREDVQGYTHLLAGQTYVYSSSDTQFDIQALIVNRSRGSVAARMPVEASDGTMKYWVSGSEYLDSDNDVVSSQLGARFVGYIGIGVGFDENNGRYYAVVDYMLWDKTDGNPDGNYVIGLQVDGEPGQRVDFFCDGMYNELTSYGLDGFSDGTPDGSISDLACGRKAVVVGSYNTRDDWASLDGCIYGYDMFEQGKISSFTSYGTIYDGRSFPTVCAPGASIISSSNEYYLDKQGLGDDFRQADFEADGRRYSWHYSVGTSMATPVVAGGIALWLEADPTLTADDVLDIIALTSRVDDDVLQAPSRVQWGAGKFDAYAGLKEVLARKAAGVSDVCAGGNLPVIVSNPDGRSIRLLRSDGTGISAALFSLDGVCVARIDTAAAEAHIDASGLNAGVYVLRIGGQNAQRILIR